MARKRRRPNAPPDDTSPVQADQSPAEDDITGGPPPFDGDDHDQDDRAPKGRPAPTIEEINERAKKDKEFWTQRDERMKEENDLYAIVKEQAAAGEMLMYMNDPKVLIEKVAGMIARRDHRIEAPPRGEKLRYAAQRIENACRWWRDYTRRRWVEGLHNPLDYDEAKCLLLRGWLVDRMMLDADDPTFTDSTMFDPIEVYPRAGGKRITRVSHVYTTTVGELIEEFPECEERYAGFDEGKQVEVKAYYENAAPYWHAVVAEGDWVKKPAKLEYWPWTITIARGAMSLHASDIQTAEEAARDVGQGFLDSIKDVYTYLNQLLTMAANTLAKEENPPVVVISQNGQPKEIELSAGSRSFLIQGDDFKVVPVGANLERVNQLLTAVQDRLNKGGIPAAMFGEGASLDSGYQSALMMSAAQDTLWTYIKAMEIHHQMRYAKFLRLFRDFADRGMAFVSKQSEGDLAGRSAWGSVLTVDDVRRNGVDVDVVYEDITPQDRVALANIATMLVDKKLISLETARGKYLNLDDPELENQRVLGDLVNMNEDVVKVLSNINLRRLGRLDELKASMESEQQQQMGGGPGGPGRGGPPPPSMREQINFKDLPPAAQMEMLRQVGLLPPGAPPPGAADPRQPGAPPPAVPPGGPGAPPIDPRLLMILARPGGASAPMPAGPPPIPPGPVRSSDIVAGGGLPPWMAALMAGAQAGAPGQPMPGGGDPRANGGMGTAPAVGLPGNVLPTQMQNGGPPSVDEILARLQMARGR